MKAKVKLYKRAIIQVKDDLIQSWIRACDVVKTDLIKSQTMPFDTGSLQNRNTTLDTKDKAKGVIKIVSDTPYARRLYFHPEYNFQQIKNAYAGVLWFQPYINGEKKDLAKEYLARFMRSKYK